MFGKIKKVFFTGVFGILYISFISQVVYVLAFMNEGCDAMLVAMAGLSVEWLVLIAARYLSKRSSASSAQYSGNNYRRH